jgi:hypothetical protein
LGPQVPASRRLSQWISEGDGIAVIVRVRDLASARAAEQQGAKALAVERAIEGLREETSLPVLWLGQSAPVDADAVVIAPDGHETAELETVVEVADEDEIETVLEELDPEIFLLCPRDDDEHDDPLEPVLGLLPDVPAGKLAIAEADIATRDEADVLERAGFDAVIVSAGHAAAVIGGRAPVS